MNRKLLWVVVAVGLFTLINYWRGKGGSHGPMFGAGEVDMGQRQEMEPAKDAAEWLKRRELDKEHTWGNVLGHWYAELPPEEEWTKLLEVVEREARKETPKKDRHSFGFSSELKPDKELLFVALMKDDEEAAETLIRKLVAESGHRGHLWTDSRLSALLGLSRDPKEGLEWVKKHQPDLLSKRSEGTVHRSEKKEWEQRLADADLEQAVVILKENLAEDRDQKLGRLLKIAKLTEDEELRSEVVEMLWRDLKKEAGNDSLSYLRPHNLIEALAENGDWKRLTEVVEIMDNQEKKREAQGWSSGMDHDSLRWTLIYHNDGPDALLAAFDAELKSGTLSVEKAHTLLKDEVGTGKPFGSLYADALMAAGRTDEAWAVMQRLVVMNLRKDPLYEQARKIAPEKFEGFLDELMEFDPFEERPLIWKAEVALAKGDVEGAKQWAEKAIALDPSDGDQGKDSRMKVYEVLSRVMAQSGNDEKAEFFREVMISIRKGEQADDYLYAGLIREATELYQEALGHFSDAYCLQSRLALTLARNGEFAKAVPHFEKAFELMPVSFGPRESHCFGCEGLFSDKRVRPIAQRILSEFMEKHPDNPRAPYLLGLVLDEMGEEREAAKAFRKALELDPRYFNAASRLFQLLGEEPELHAEREALLASMLKIAPYPELGRYYEMRTDLRQAWLDADKVRDSPVTLADWALKPAPRDEQFSKMDSGFIWVQGAEKAMDGWSRDELCRDNELLRLVQDL